MIRKILLFLFALVLASPLFAQTLTVTKDFAAVPNSSVMAMYKNQFGKWEKPDLDDTVPYAVIRVALEGDAKDVNTAKKKLGLYLGTQRMVVDVNIDEDNVMLFLVPSGAGHVELRCGDGCTPQTIIDLARLRSNTVYSGKVHFVPVEGTEVVEVVDKEQLKKELFAEFASMLQEQQAAKSPEQEVERPAQTTIEESTVAEDVPNNLSKYQRYAQNAKIKTLVMGQMGYSVAPQLSFGALVGQMYRGYGWYMSGRSNFQFGHSAIASCDAEGLVNGVKPFYSGNTKTSHLSVSAGFMMNVLETVMKNKFNTLGFYVGGGYGKRELLAETTSGEWIKYAPTSHNGFVANLGVFGSVAGVTLNVGVSTINFKYIDLEMGVGFMF